MNVERKSPKGFVRKVLHQLGGLCFRWSHGGLRTDGVMVMHRVLTAESAEHVADAVLACKMTLTDVGGGNKSLSPAALPQAYSDFQRQSSSLSSSLVGTLAR